MQQSFSRFMTLKFSAYFLLMIASKAFYVRVINNLRQIVFLSTSSSIGAEYLDRHKGRMSHYNFFNNRKWGMVEQFWSDTVKDSSSLQTFIEGDDRFGVTNLEEINRAGLRGEFLSKDQRYSSRRTFAVRIGYVGTMYNGYQRQNKVSDVYTVEDDLKEMLGVIAYGAGRTDADVSAVSQVVSLVGKIDDDSEGLLQKMKSSDAVLSGRMAVYGCVRAPKKFNARSCATWRRYLYLLPLNVGEYIGFDIDIEFVNEAFKRLENLELPYNGFAHQEDRTKGDGLKDYCTMYRARAFKVDVTSNGLGLQVPKKGVREHPQSESPSYPLALSDDLGGSDRDLDSGTGSDGDTSSTVDNDSSVGNGIHYGSRDLVDDVKPYNSTSSAMCVELVGSRFLRKMVRILVATAARESVLSKESRNVNILLDICNSRDRSKASVSVPGGALCFAGVGYDSLDLALYKFMPKKNQDLIIAENNVLIAADEKYLPHPVTRNISLSTTIDVET